MFGDDNVVKKENKNINDNSRLILDNKDTNLNNTISNNRLNNIQNDKEKGVSKFIQQIKDDEKEIKNDSEERFNDNKNKLNNNSKYEK